MFFCFFCLMFFLFVRFCDVLFSFGCSTVTLVKVFSVIIFLWYRLGVLVCDRGSVFF